MNQFHLFIHGAIGIEPPEVKLNLKVEQVVSLFENIDF